MDDMDSHTFPPAHLRLRAAAFGAWHSESRRPWHLPVRTAEWGGKIQSLMARIAEFRTMHAFL